MEKLDVNVKYYTPSIEEFYIGFECEYKIDLRYLEWESQVCNSDDILLIYSLGEHGTLEDNDRICDKYRVKYLDKNDIEELGFKYSGKAVDDWFILKKSLRLSSGHFFHEFKIQHDRKNSFVNEEDHCYNIKIYAFGTGIEDVLFEGVIKNKSELKRLLKQLGI